MSIISIHNYESFYLDFLEGTISEHDKGLLSAFLDSRPDLKADLEELELIHLDAEASEPFDKSVLLQTINRQNAEDYIVQYVENQLDADDEEELSDLLQKYDDLQELYWRYKKTILPADDIVFPDKVSLKKNRRSLIYYMPLIGAAAAVLFFVFIYRPDRIPERTGVAFAVELSDSVEDSLGAELQPNEKKEVAVVEQLKARAEDVISTVPGSSEDARIGDVPIQPDNTVKTGNPDALGVKQKNADTPESVIASADDNQMLGMVPRDEAEKINDEADGFNADTLVQEEISKQKLVASEAQTVKEWVRSQLREKLFRSRPERTGKIQTDEVISSVTAAIDRNTGDSFALDYSADDNSKTYTVSFGRFSFTRIKSKK